MKKNYYFKNIWLILMLLFSFSFLFASYIPNLYEASVVDLLPKDRIMLWGEHIYTYDYNVYLSKIKQGAEGRWTVVDKYDNNPQQKGVFLQMLYLLSGKVGGVFKLTPTLIFHLLRTLLSFAWVWTIIYINLYFLKKPRLVFFGVLLSILAASFPVFYQYLGSWWVGYHMSWWTEMDVLKRISYIPHYTLNYIIISILTLLLSSYSNNSQFLIFKRFKTKNLDLIKNFNPFDKLRIDTEQSRSIKFQISNFNLICLVLFFSFFIHPSAGILFIFSWLIFHLLRTVLLRSYQSGHILRIFIYTFILFVVVAIPLLYFRNVTAGYPWKSLVDFDKYSRFPLNVKEYILALGPIFFIGVLGLILALVKKEEKLFSLVSWILGAFAAIYLFKKFPYQSELRFVQTANHIPLAILSVYFFNNLLESFRRIRQPAETEKSSSGVKLGNNSRLAGFLANARNDMIKIIVYGVIIFIILLGLVQSYFSIRAQTDFIHQRAVAVQPLVPYPPQVMYPLKDFWEALIWLENNTSRNDIIISQVTAGNYIPAYSGNFVYLGHNPETPHYDERVNNVNQFFSGTMNEKDALRFLKEENISYVFFGPQEKEKSVEDISKYSFLKQAFSSYYVTVYRVE